MIYGIGTDIIEVDRLKKSLQRTTGLIHRIFSAIEISHCTSNNQERNLNFEKLSARFAAKEAFLKACGTGLRGEYKLTEISITNDELGKPAITLTGKSKKEFETNINGKIFVSLSHLQSIAQAVVIIEKN